MIQDTLFSENKVKTDGLKPGYVWTGNKGEQRKALSKEGQKAVRMQKCERYEKKILTYRGHGKSTKEIADIIGVQEGTVRYFLRRYGKDDPFKIKVVDMFKAGDSTKYICKELGVSKTTVTYALREHGVDPWDTYLKKTSESYRENGETGRKLKQEEVKRRREERKKITIKRNISIAHDLYCYYKDGITLENASRETGWSSSWISVQLNKWVDEYAIESRNRRDNSEIKRFEVKRGKRSRTFRYEKDFVECLTDKISMHKVGINIRGESTMEIDIKVESLTSVYLIEAKISTRMVDIARAIGQTMLNADSLKDKSGKNIVSMICIPVDCDMPIDLSNQIKGFGIILCDEISMPSFIL